MFWDIRNLNIFQFHIKLNFEEYFLHKNKNYNPYIVFSSNLWRNDFKIYYQVFVVILWPQA